MTFSAPAADLPLVQDRKKATISPGQSRVASNETIVSAMNTEGDLTLGRRDHDEVAGALVAVRRFACEMSEVFADLGQAEQPEDAGARAIVDACDRALEAAPYDGAR
jgi:hypothetical protein